MRMGAMNPLQLRRSMHVQHVQLFSAVYRVLTSVPLRQLRVAPPAGSGGPAANGEPGGRYNRLRCLIDSGLNCRPKGVQHALVCVIWGRDGDCHLQLGKEFDKACID